MPARDQYHDLVHRLLVADGWRVTHDPGRHLYLAVGREVWQDIFEEPIGRGILAEYNLRLLVFDSIKEVILQWMPIP
jgi:hypothetical protein